jgi:uncharacterized protein YeaO (DUF488 family)
MKKIHLKRVYETASKEDGIRILVDRLWPRGMKKEEMKFDAWLKDVSPSPALRTWYSHDPAKWEEFQKRYTAELQENPAAWQPIVKALETGPVTLLYAAHDTEHSHALCLKNYLDSKIHSPSR